MDTHRAVRESQAPPLELVERFAAHVKATGLLPEGSAVTVAVSGGLDSVALLDLLDLASGRYGWRLSAAHFDHRMRVESAEDARWVGEFCHQRGVPFRMSRAAVVPKNESEARELRYAFLLSARLELQSDFLATAHQADDQAETVLFRLLRGSGLAGLSGIPARRSPAIIRPLLPFWRAEIEEYARLRGVSWLTDPSNLDPTITRNFIRNVLIPSVERDACPDLRRQLCRLAELARRASGVVDRMVGEAADELVIESSESRIVVARSGLLAYDTSVRAHLLRVLAARVGPQPGRVGTRIALEFINTCSSGRSIDLAGGLVVRREFDRFHFERRFDEPVSGPELVLSDTRSGEGDVKIAGVVWRVRWGLGDPDGETERGEEFACFDPAGLRFPLTVRGWQPGDRICLRAGTRKLKKVFVDKRIGLSQRGSYPLLTDSEGVHWIVGLTRGASAVPEGRGEVFRVWLRRKS